MDLRAALRRTHTSTFWASCVLLACALIVRRAQDPRSRPFVPKDPSLSFPAHANTVPFSAVLAMHVPLGLLILLVEHVVAHRGHGSRLTSWVYSVQGVLLMVAGSFGQFSVVELVKPQTGALRPSFLTTCVPDEASGTGVDTYDCTGADTTEIRDDRLSFISGHTAMAVYQAFFCAVYLFAAVIARDWLARRVPSRRPFWVYWSVYLVSGVWFVYAAFVGISRINDYAHHFVDVVGGALVGASAAVATALLNEFEISCDAQIEAAAASSIRGSESAAVEMASAS